MIDLLNVYFWDFSVVVVLEWVVVRLCVYGV